MRLNELFEWLDDFDRPTDTNWLRITRILIWALLLATGFLCYATLFTVFAAE